MAQGVTLDYASASAKPPLDMGVRLRLSVMMFLQFAVWGSFWTVLNVYCDKTLHFNKVQIGSLYGTMALGAIISMMFAGQLADRVMSSEYLMAIFHLGGAALLFAMARIHTFEAMWWTTLAYALLYNPTLAIANSLAFHNIPDATRDFPTLRVLGTIGWIAAGFSVDFVLGKGAASTNKPLLMAAVLSVILGLFSLTLPHTPPSGKKGDALPFLRAFGLLKDLSFGVFFGLSFAITIALAFYYNFTGNFLSDLNVQNVATVQTFGQMSEILFMLLLPFALKRFGMKGVLIVGMAAWAVRYGLFSLGHPYVLVLIGVILHGVCFDFFLAAGFIHTDNKAPAAIRGSAQALFSFLTYGVGMWIGNIVAGYVVQHFTTSVPTPVRHDVTNWRDVWLVPAVGSALCLALFILLWRDRAGKVEDEGVQVEPAASLAPEA
jgi:nucleoside transporter